MLPRVEATRPSRSALLGLGLWVLAIAAALFAQRLLTPEGRIEQGALAYALAAALAVAGAVVVDRQSQPRGGSGGAPVLGPQDPVQSGVQAVGDGLVPSQPIERQPTERRDKPVAYGQPLPRVPGADPMVLAPAEPVALAWPWTLKRPLSLALALVGVACVASSTYLVVTNGSPELANSLWVVGLGYVALSAWPGRVASPKRQRIGRRVWIELGAVAAILGVALTLGLIDLSGIPVKVHGDEAAVGLWARKLLQGEIRSVFGVGWYNLPILSFVPSALTMRLFGDDLFGLRLASVAQGVLSVLFLYLLARRLFSARIAAIAAFLMAVSQLAIHYSRLGINYVQAELAVVLFLYLLVEAVETRRPVLYVLAGFAGGLCIQVYFAARIAPLLAGLYVLHRLALERGFLDRQWRGLLVVALAVLVFVAPFGVAYVRSPQAYVSRAQGVNVLSEASISHEYFAYKVDSPAEVLKRQVVNTLEAFNLRGETSQQFGWRAPLLDFATSALFVLGVAVATLRPRQTRYFLLAAWLWLTLLFGSVLTVDALFSPHIVVAIPVLFVFPAIVVDAAWRAGVAAFGRASWVICLILTLGLAAFALRDNYRGYFEAYPAQQPADFFTTLARYSTSVDDRYQVYLIGRRDTSLRYDTMQFLAPSLDGVDVRDKPLALPLEEVPESRGIAFVIEAAYPDGPTRLDALREAYPRGRLETYSNPRGVPFFTAFLVENSELRAAIASQVEP